LEVYLLALIESVLTRSIGDWVSHRHYLYVKSKKVDTVVTRFSINYSDDSQDSLLISWSSERGEGSMLIVPSANVLVDEEDLHSSPVYLNRDVGYATNEPTSSRIMLLDDTELRTTTAYDAGGLGDTFNEHISLINPDTRVRTNCAYKNGALHLIGQYLEYRV